MMRYVRLLGVQLRASFQLAMQYRVDFLVGGTMSLFWLTWNLLPMVILWRSRPTIAGWTFPEALLVAAWFTLLRGLLEGAVQPSLIAVVEHIRKGTLDFVLLAAAVTTLYAIFILVACAAFWVVRLDNLIYLFNSIFDAGRWPSAVFRGAWRLLFTFVIPLALMTTYPAEALLGRLAPSTLGFALGGAALFTLAARLVWLRAIGHYTSASS